MKKKNRTLPRSVKSCEFSPKNKNEIDTAWNQFSSFLKDKLPERAFSAWIQPLEPVAFENECITVKLPGRFYFDFLEEHYSDLINDALEHLSPKIKTIDYVLTSEKDSKPAEAPVYKPQQELDFNPKTNPAEAGLNSLYKFENFIEGPGNQLARAASLAVATLPERCKYNPLLIYGGVGLGKTHLIQAIGNYALEINPYARVCYLSSETFTRRFVDAIRENRTEQFSASLRRLDILLLDDVQFLAGRTRTMMEFFHLFNTLHQEGKQIVLTSDLPPRELHGIDERLISRIGWGLVCDISPPDYDTRVAIVQHYAEENSINIPVDLADYLAKRFNRNVRELQGACIRLLAAASLNGKKLSVENAEEILCDLVGKRNGRIPVEHIQKIVSEYFNTSPDLLLAKLRTRDVSRARMVAMALSVRHTGLSLKQIGKRFGNRDHTTVLHAREMVNSWSMNDTDFSASLEKLNQKIENASF